MNSSSETPMLKLPPSFRLHYKEVTTSTNSDAEALAKRGAGEFTLVWARQQTAGRGRFSRNWISDVGNLYWSIVVKPEKGVRPLEELAFVSGLAVLDVARKNVDEDRNVRVKWPNDILINNAKTSGILIEVGPNQDWVVVGVGINLLIAPDSSAVMYPATCLAMNGADHLTVDDLCQQFSWAFFDRYIEWINEGFSNSMRGDFVDSMWRKDELIGVSLNPEKTIVLEGINRGINELGHLQLELITGELKSLPAADVLFR